MNKEKTVTVEVRTFEELFGVIEEDENVPVCPSSLTTLPREPTVS